MKRVLYLIILFLLVEIGAFAQQREVTGIVKNESDEVLVGANIVVIGTTTGVVTDANGKFSIMAGLGDSLEVSYLGFVEKKIMIGADDFIEVILNARAVGLSEVVAVGYGVQKKTDLTGSISTISAEQLKNRPVMRASSALEGLAPGLTVTQKSGQPGNDGGTLRIRGVGTLGDSDPLVLIDGIEGSLDGIDPNDIENISVLKDAASAAIYGSRAANGVILISTKKGSEEQLKVNYNGYLGWERFTDLPEYADGIHYLEAFKVAYENEGRTPIFDDNYIEDYKQNYLTDPDHYPNTDWQKEAYTGSGFVQHHSIQLSGGSKMFKILGSVAYQDQEGVLPNFDSKRYSFRVNSQLNVLDNLQVALRVSGRHSPITSPSAGGGLGNVNRIPPIYPAVLTDGRYGVGWNGENPVASTRAGGLKSSEYETLEGTVQVNYQPVKDLGLELNFTPQFNDTWIKSFARTVNTYNPDSETPAYTHPQKSSLTESSIRIWQNTLHLLANYNKSMGNHNFHLLTGYEQIAYRNDNFKAFRDAFALEDFQQLNAGAIDNWSNGGTGSEWALRSVFGRLTYDFQGKYLFQANLRRDESSRFADGNRVGYFPSFSAGWRISEEAFMKDLNWLSDLKLRASWGELGNQNIGTYPFATTISLGQNYIFGNAPVSGASQLSMANAGISWETTSTKGLGLDLGLFQNKLSITYDFYIRNTKDILLQLPIPEIIGMSAPFQNAGEVKNTGWDLSLNYRSQAGKFKYSIGFNLSDVKNEVTDLKGVGPFIDDYTIVEEGQPIDALYGYKAIGLFQDQQEIDNSPTQFGTYAPGDIKYQNVNGDNSINADDKIVMGNQIPRLTFGMNGTLQYGGFDLSFLIQGVGKRDIFVYRDATWAFFNAGKIQTWQLDYWTPSNPNAKYPRLIAETTHNNFENSSFWMYDASYIRLKDLQLGYSLPKQLLGQTFIDNLRIYVSGNNLLTKDKMPKGWDPERESGTAGIYPVNRTIVFGMDLTF